MFIEKSPYHMSKAQIKSDNGISTENESKEKQENKFFKWIKGLINPLQNLPIISGIYSSVNAKNEASDRDLVQNGLGGFIYGGPIGAIGGVGNWVFNKIFDKTPSELFLEVTGISKIWNKKSKTANKLVRVDLGKIEKQKNEVKNEILKKPLIENNVNSNAIEFIYPKWNPEAINKKDHKDLSSIRELYNLSSSSTNKRLNIKA